MELCLGGVDGVTVGVDVDSEDAEDGRLSVRPGLDPRPGKVRCPQTQSIKVAGSKKLSKCMSLNMYSEDKQRVERVSNDGPDLGFKIKQESKVTDGKLRIAYGRDRPALIKDTTNDTP